MMKNLILFLVLVSSLKAFSQETISFKEACDKQLLADEQCDEFYHESEDICLENNNSQEYCDSHMGEFAGQDEQEETAIENTLGEL